MAGEHRLCLGAWWEQVRITRVTRTSPGQAQELPVMAGCSGGAREDRVPVEARRAEKGMMSWIL